VGIIRNGQLVALEDIETLKQKTGKKIRVKMKEDPTSLLSNDTVTLVDGWIEITVQSNPDKWLKKLSQYTILDLEVKEFSLEDYFMRYYIEETGA
jgi:ABC-2 type transport system ATP-binding protein